jgi:hypothetical protein
MRIRTLVLALVGALAVGTIQAKPRFTPVDVTQTVDSESFVADTKTVVIYSVSGSDTCFFELFTNVETAVDATLNSLPLEAGQALTFELRKCDASTDLATCKDSETFNAQGRQARGYVTLSHICDSGETATWRVYSK